VSILAFIEVRSAKIRGMPSEIRSMQKNYYGSERQQLLDWLTGEWLAEGAVACFVEGFPGVGKSDLAAAVTQSAESKGWHTVYVEIPDQANPSFHDALHSVADRLADQGHARMSTSLSDRNTNPAFALERGLRDKVLIVFDEAGRLLDEDGQASSELSSVLSYLRNRPGLPGRVLFLSDVAIQQDRWSETFAVKKLSPPTPDEAVALLTDRLHGQRCSDAIPRERMPDLVQVLGCNPRAIETLAVALTCDPLDEIIGADPGMWRIRDRVVSRDFLERLERRLLERTLAHLEPQKFMGLTMLAVHRKSFEKEAYGAVVSGARKNWRDLQNTLISRFFVTFRLGWNSMNPVVRAIALARLKDNPSAFATAHSMAAEYHLRHFESKQFALDPRRLTASYAELRYHMFNAGRVHELRDVAIRLGDHLNQRWEENTKIPEDAVELDERIGVLSALLEDEGPRSLETYLTRCLVGRGKKSDLQQALIHITRACSGGTLAQIWLLKAQIHERLGETDQAIQTIFDGLKVVTDMIAALYKLGGDLLSQEGRPDDAIFLLREGILKVAPDNSLSTLYLAAAALLEAQAKPDEALVLLTEGIRRIPPDQPLFSLYHAAALLLRRQDRTSEAIELLIDGLRIVPPDKGASTLYQSAAEMMQSEGRVDLAITLLMDGIGVIPPEKSLCALYLAAAKMLIQQNRRDDAIGLLKQGIEILPVDKNADLLYRETANMLSERGNAAEAIELLRTGMELIPASKISASLHADAAGLLLQSNQPDAAIETLKKGISAAFNVKTALTLYRNAAGILVRAGHINSAITLVEQGVKRLPDHQLMTELLQTLKELAGQEAEEHAVSKQDLSRTTGAVVLVMATEWSSAHGGLSTFNRHLCAALATQGHQVYCAVPQANDGDIAHAQERGVTLVLAAPTPGAAELSGLSRRLQLPKGVSPTIIIGHGRITGAFAKDQQVDFFQKAKRIHFVHMAAGEIEWFKEPEKAAEKADAREKIELALASDAQLVVAVGPRLMREISDLLRGSRSNPRVVEFVPGPTQTPENTSPPHLNHCLVLGRADDCELKGLDIAAHALSYVIRDKHYGGALPELIIRGASPGTGDELRRKLQGLCNGVDVLVKPKEYSSDEHTVESDIRRAALLLMPSRREGFGLVALEALAQGTPVLATDKSGFADIVRRLAPEHLALNTVVETPSDRASAARNWADAISRQLTDKGAAFARAAELGQLLAKEANWDIATRKLMAEVEFI
jgi:tetratricopeptide (TPR) repeat protein/glycosyltransferase involved in cell wall biosynthesis